MSAFFAFLSTGGGIALFLLGPMIVLWWKLGAYLDQARRTSEERARDHERNFHLKNKAEDVLRDLAALCRAAQTKIERETPPPKL